MCQSADRVYCSVRMNGKCLNQLSVFFSFFSSSKFFAASFHYYYLLCPTKIYELLFSLFLCFFPIHFFPPRAIFIKNEKETSFLCLFLFENESDVDLNRQTHRGLEAVFESELKMLSSVPFEKKKNILWFRCQAIQAGWLYYIIYIIMVLFVLIFEFYERDSARCLNSFLKPFFFQCGADKSLSAKS